MKGGVYRMLTGIRGGRENTVWAYNDTRSRFRGCICRLTGEGAYRFRPRSRQRNVCPRNSDRYAVLTFLYISVMNSCS